MSGFVKVRQLRPDEYEVVEQYRQAGIAEEVVGRSGDRLYVVKFEPMPEPATSEGMRFVGMLFNPLPHPVTTTFEIREGYRDEANPGKLIATRSHQAPPRSEGEILDELSIEEGALIRKFDDLYLRAVREDD